MNASTNNNTETCEWTTRPFDRNNPGVCGEPATHYVFAPEVMGRRGASYGLCDKHHKEIWRATAAAAKKVQQDWEAVKKQGGSQEMPAMKVTVYSQDKDEFTSTYNSAFLLPADALFPLGQIISTEGAETLLDSLGEDAGSFILRHASGDWGDMCEEDRDVNQKALGGGGQLMSEYKTPKGTLWIFTEADRSETTVMIPDEY